MQEARLGDIVGTHGKPTRSTVKTNSIRYAVVRRRFEVRMLGRYSAGMISDKHHGFVRTTIHWCSTGIVLAIVQA